jgi:branched-chain amino acid aminotransferase
MSLQNLTGVIWIDGQFIPWEEARVHVLTHTLHYGVGVFEGVRSYETKEGPAIFRLEDHTHRLFESAHILDMAIPYSKDVLNTVQLEILQRNQLMAAYLRPMVFYGGESLSLNTVNLSTHVMVAAFEWKAYMEGVDITEGIKVKTSSFTRNPSNSVLCRAKSSGNYLNSILALKEATACGAHEALLLDQAGYVAEGSGENIFIVRKGILYTPDLSAILAGITRESVMILAQDLGLSVIEKRITRDELYIADEAFFTGTATEIIPIAMVDNRKIGTGRRGPITQVLQTKYQQAVRGELKQYQHWLTTSSRRAEAVG